MKRLLSISCLLLLTMGMILVRLHARQTETLHPRTACGFSEVYKADGWKIPALTGATPRSPRASLSSKPGVYVTILSPGDAGLDDVMLPSCPKEFPGRLALDSRPIRVSEIWKFDVAGQVFAYSVSFNYQRIEGTIRKDSLAGSTVTYYDPDGSGTYGILRYPERLFPGNISIPSWLAH